MKISQDKIKLKIKLIPEESNGGCRGCYFNNTKGFNECNIEDMLCVSRLRDDGRDVIWVTKGEENESN